MTDSVARPAAQYSLRPATALDRPAIEELVFTILAEYDLKSDPDGTDSDLADLEAYARNGGAFDVLLDENALIIGSVGLHRVSASTCELRKMYLAKQARGRGLGRTLLNHAIARARLLGFSRIILETATVLREAIALYERSGFRQYQAEHLACRCDRAYFLELEEKAKG